MHTALPLSQPNKFVSVSRILHENVIIMAFSSFRKNKIKSSLVYELKFRLI